METETKQNTISLPAAIVVGSIVIAGAIIWASGGYHASNALGTTPQKQATPQQNVDMSKVKINGEPFAGNPQASVAIAYWFDYQCPFCKQFEEQTMPQVVKDYVDTGKIKVVFKDFQFLGPDSQTLGRYSRAVWDVAPGKFYQWHKAVYDNQGTENTGWATKEKIISITASVLGASDAAKASQLVVAKGTEYQKAMDSDRAEGGTFGVDGTPGFVIGKQLLSGAQPYAQIKAAIETALTSK